MNVARQRLLNVLAGIAFSLIGISFYGVAAYFALVPPKPIGEAPLVKAELTSCVRTLDELGFQHNEVAGQELRISKAGLDNPERALADASLAISACGLPLNRFCMGPGCKQPAIADGIYFALATKIEQSK